MHRESKEQTRARNVNAILRAAEMAFAQHGYRGASLSRIAEMAGVPKSNIAYYFSSKQKLYEEVLSNICMLWLDAGDEISKENDPEAALTSYIHHKLDLARSRPYGSKVWANEIIAGAPFIQSFLSTTVKAWITQRAYVLEYWMDQGFLQRTDPQTIFYLIWSTTQHYADFNTQIEILNDEKPLSDEQWENAKSTIARMIIRGLTVRSA